MEEKEIRSKGFLSVREAHEGCDIEIGSLLCMVTCASLLCMVTCASDYD